MAFEVMVGGCRGDGGGGRWEIGCRHEVGRPMSNQALRPQKLNMAGNQLSTWALYGETAGNQMSTQAMRLPNVENGGKANDQSSIETTKV